MSNNNNNKKPNTNEKEDKKKEEAQPKEDKKNSEGEKLKKDQTPQKEKEKDPPKRPLPSITAFAPSRNNNNVESKSTDGVADLTAKAQALHLSPSKTYTPPRFASLGTPVSRKYKPPSPTGQRKKINRASIKQIESETKWPSFVKWKKNHFWVFSFNRQYQANMGDYFSYVKTNLLASGWFDLGNSSYCIWTVHYDYVIMRDSLLQDITGHPNVDKITYVTFIHATVPVNYSALLVRDIQAMLLADPNPDVIRILQIADTEAEQNAH